MSPMRPELYPDDWKEISFLIRDANGWQCQECNLQCRRPGEPFDTLRRTLTISHYFHDTQAPEVFLAAMCARCHLRHDAAYHAAKRRQSARRYHMALLPLHRPTATRADVDDLERDWPQLPDLEGVDLFLEQYGEPFGTVATGDTGGPT